MSTLDTLLDEELNNGYTVLTVDEPSRSIQYDGNLILGVEHDKYAERIYFVAPKIVGDDIDLSADTTRIDIKFTNGYGDSYFIQSTDVKTQEDGNVSFSWLLTEKVAVTHGNISFCVCAKQINAENIIEKEWHTAPFVGKVVTGIDVAIEDSEIITDITCASYALVKEVELYKEQLVIFQHDINGLATMVANKADMDSVYATIESAMARLNGEIDSKLSALESEIYAHLADLSGRVSALENSNK